MTEIVLHASLAEGGDLAGQLRRITASEGQDRAPARVRSADEPPDQTPEQIEHEHVPDPDMDCFQNDLAVGARAEGVVIEDHVADGDKTEDAQDIQPMKNARGGVPHFVFLEFHGDWSLRKGAGRTLSASRPA